MNTRYLRFFYFAIWGLLDGYDEVAEELEKMKDGFAKQIDSTPTIKHDIKNENNMSYNSENKAEKTDIPYYMNMLHQN